MPKRRRGQRSPSNRRRGRDLPEAPAPEFYEYEPGVEVPWDVTHVRVPPSVRILPHDVFLGLKHLVEVELSEGLLEIERSAFSGCISLVRVRLSSTLVDIGALAFYGCTSLTMLDLPEGLIHMHSNCFRECSLLRRVRIPSTVTTIGYSAFENCSALSEVILVDGIQEIDGYGFAGCESLVSLVLPASMIHVSDKAFRGCTALRTVTLCGGITGIGSDAFEGCNMLDHVRAPSAVLIVTTHSHNSSHLARDGTIIPIDRSQTVIASECFNSMSPEDMRELKRRIGEVLRTLALVEGRGQIRDLLAPHEARHKEEVATLLELALWKARLAGSDGAVPETRAPGAQGRQESRIRCGAGDVIPNVLPFL